MVTKNSKKILNYLLRGFEFRDMNQISRVLGVSVGSSFKILKELEVRDWNGDTDGEVGSGRYF